MKGLFKSLEIKSESPLSKQDKKKNDLDIKTEYKIYNISSKLKLIGDSNFILFFRYYDRTFPTVKNLNSGNCNQDLYKRVFLDSGAIGPLTRGADVMCAGIIKYKDKSNIYQKDDIVIIEIIEQDIIAVGIALISFDETLKKNEGAAIEILHIRGDSLDLFQ